MNEKEPSKTGWWRPLIIVLFVIAMLFLARQWGLGEKLQGLRGWFENLGPWGPLAFVGIYIAATVAAVPGSALTLMAGPVFGSLWGVVLVSIASTIGAALCFLIARYFARDSVAAWLEKSPKFQRLDRLTREQGGIIVALTRLVPLFPFNLLNYGFGLTQVSFVTYVFLSWLCMLPGTVLYIVGADALWTSLTQGNIPWPLLAVLAPVFVVLFLLIRFAKGKLNESKADALQEPKL